MSSSDRDRAFFGHPIGLSTLFFTEMWERFSYYGMRAFLILYMTAKASEGGRDMSVVTGGLIIGIYTASVYFLSLPGGWIADRFIGQRRGVAFGGVGIMLGNILLALPNDNLFYPGLALAAIGTGLLKPNVSTIVGQLYSPDDPRREAGFTIYYMDINIGAFFAPIVCGLFFKDTFLGWLSDFGIWPGYAWKFAFGAVAIGMAAGVVQFVLGQGRLGKAGAEPTIPSDPRRAQRDRFVLIGIVATIAAIAIACAIFRDSITEDGISTVVPIALAVISIGLFVGLYTSARDVGERRRVLAMIPLFIGAIAFFGIFEQASSMLNIFARDNVHPKLFGFMGTTDYQAINSIFIIALAPVFAWIWIALGRAKKEPSSVNKFGIGMLFIALSFVVMLPTLAPVKDGERVTGLYLVALYFFYTCSELCISPVGLASMSRLAPTRLAGMAMGTWFLATSIGNFIAGQAAGVSATRGHAFLFYTIIISSLAVGAGLFAIAPVIRKMMSGETKSAELPKATAIEPPAEDIAS